MLQTDPSARKRATIQSSSRPPSWRSNGGPLTNRKAHLPVVRKCQKWMIYFNFMLLLLPIINILHFFCVPLERRAELLDLGIIVTSTLSWSSQINKQNC